MILSPERIKATRKAAGFSQQHLADLVGVSYRTISRCELGLHIPRSDLLGRLACALGADVGSFFEHAADGRCICAPGRPPSGGLLSDNEED